MVGLRVAGSEIGRVAPGARRGEDLMAQAAQKITLSSSRDIPFDKLVLSQSNVRRIKAGVSVEELAEDIARRGLLQGLSVRPVLDADGVETGKFEIPAGGRRFQALALLVKQKRLAKTAPVPCVLRDVTSDILAEDDSLAENMQRVALHPLDQFHAFVALRDKGQGEEVIRRRSARMKLQSTQSCFRSIAHWKRNTLARTNTLRRSTPGSASWKLPWKPLSSVR